MELLFSLIVLVVLLAMGFGFGRLAESRHLRALAEREAATRDVLVCDLKSFPQLAPDSPAPTLVVGEVVIASDYFKTWIMSLKKLVGGELGSFLTLVDRARREAVLRAVEQAKSQGYNAVCNVRIVTADIGGAAKGGNKAAAMVTVMVSATAYRRA
jgi:uncharacterized protein YbjQ (UPF0145 family)